MKRNASIFVFIAVIISCIIALITKKIEVSSVYLEATVVMAVALLFSFLFKKYMFKEQEKMLEQMRQSLKNDKFKERQINTIAIDDMLLPLAIEINTLLDQDSLVNQALLWETEKFSKIIGSMEEGLIVFDDGLKVININQSAKGFFNQISQSESFLFNLTADKDIIEAATIASNNGKGSKMLWEFSGGYAQIRIHPITVWNERRGKEIEGGVMLITDITERKMSDQMRTEFFSNVSHEMKTPLTSIMGYSQLLMATNKDKNETIENYSKKISDESLALSALIDDILKISNLEESQEKPVAVNLLDIAREVRQNLSTQADSKGIFIEINGESVTIMAVEEEIYQVIKNLAENAIRYNKQDGSVVISMFRRDHFVYITVSDTGIGIPKEDLARIFERFYRVDKARSRALGGTGLGLSIVKHVALKYGGECFVESSIGVGTKFTVKIPD